MGQILSFLPIGGSIDNSKLPVLNENYPQDVTIMESADGNATFEIKILEHGKPAEYTYQWYVNGVAVDGATNIIYTKTGLTSAAAYTVYCEVTNKAGTVTSRVATLNVASSKPVYSYGGTASLEADGSYNYKMKFLTSGVLKFTNLGCFQNGIDVFCVGGGGAGSSPERPGGAGGGGGRTNESYNISIETNKDYTITVGAGGVGAKASYGANGGETSGFGVSAAGGNGASNVNGGAGGSGGGGAGLNNGDNINHRGGVGGTNGGDGGSGYNSSGGKGQGKTTKAFGEGDPYAGGGGGDAVGGSAGGSVGGGTGGGGNGTANTGGGGGAGRGTGNYPCAAGSGGSGVIIIRNHRS